MTEHTTDRIRYGVMMGQETVGEDWDEMTDEEAIAYARGKQEALDGTRVIYDTLAELVSLKYRGERISALWWERALKCVDAAHSIYHPEEHETL